MDKNAKICPIMSRPSPVQWGEHRPDEGDDLLDLPHAVPCQQAHCALWITVYTTENQPTAGCALALQPKMVNGQLQV